MESKIEIISKLSNSITFKVFIIGFLALVLLIPAIMIQELIKERQESQNAVITEISSKWGNKQTIAGPVLTLAIKNGKNAHFLPENLNISGNIAPEIRYRGIYKVVVYNAILRVTGNFSKPDFQELKIDEDEINFNEAFISIGIPDMRGIKKAVKIKWNKSEYIAKPGINSDHFIESGISININPNDIIEDNQFEFTLDLNGSDILNFTPMGKETSVNLSSTWNNPSFGGNFIPNSRIVNKNGFEANWNVLHLNRNFPQKWLNNEYDIEGSEFGVKLLFPVDQYQQSMRTAKYAIMFIVLTFAIFFLTEVLNKYRIHPIQYSFIGISLTIFYILLLSISEIVNFNLAFIISGFAIILLVTAYSASIFKQFKPGLVVCLSLTALYSFLYVIVQLQDYSLLLGATGLLVIMAIVMYLSRKIDWYASIIVNNKNES